MPKFTFASTAKTLSVFADLLSIIYVLANIKTMSICNPGITILVYSIICTVLFFLMPYLWGKMATKNERVMIIIISTFTTGTVVYEWNKISSSENCIVKNPISQSIKSTVSITKPIVKIEPQQEKVKSKPQRKKSLVAIPNTTKVDTPKRKPDTPKSQFDLRGASLNGSAVGINPTVTNNNYEPQFTDVLKAQFIKDFNKLISEGGITSKVVNFNLEQGSNGAKIMSQVKDFIQKNGYIVGPTGMSASYVPVKNIRMSVTGGQIELFFGIF